ncbi:hypothetical protein [Bacillus sp. AFS051223]|nr:hypothetical protein [Bacillus sp. AFS051223]
MLMQVVVLGMLDDGYTIHQIISMFKNESGAVWHAWVDEKRGCEG